MKFSRYLLFNYLKTFSLIMIGSIIVFIIIDFVGNIKMWLYREMAQVEEYYLNYLPYIIYLVTPVAVMLTAIASIGAMSRHLEISAMQSAGRSPFKILMPLFVLGFIITVGLFEVGEVFLPDSNYRRLEITETRVEERRNPRVKEKDNFVFIGSDQSDWYFKHYDGVNRKGDIVSVLLRQEGIPTARYDAKRIEWGDSSWILENCWERKFLPDATILVKFFEKFDLEKSSSVMPEDIINSRQSHEEMSAKQIRHRIEIMKRSGEETQKMETQWHFKYSGPVTALVTLWLALSLAHKYNRNGGLSQKFGIGIILTFSYYIVIRVGLQMGENGILEPWLGAWIGHLIYGTLSLIMLLKSFKL